MPDISPGRLIEALERDDVAAVQSMVEAYPDLLHAGEKRPVITFARSAATAQRLLDMGAHLDVVGDWWASGFGTFPVSSEVAEFLVGRGAALTAHAAAGLGLVDRLREMLLADPTLVHTKGGDGCTPLHFSRDVATARLLLESGARVDARDEDHESTPAQWLIGRSPEIVRLLLEYGTNPDIFVAVALGDRQMVQSLIDADPRCPGYRIGKLPEFPPIGYNHRGGTIYQWTLAFNSYPHQIALLKGHPDLFEYLYERSDTTTRLLVSCLLAHGEEALAIAAQNPGLVASLPPADHELLPRYCWETNTNYEAVRLMLDVGFPITATEHSHGYSALHNAAWSGSADLVDLLIARGHPVDLRDPAFQATPLGYALHCYRVAKRHPEGEYGRVVKSLVDAGCPLDNLKIPTGDPEIDKYFE